MPTPDDLLLGADSPARVRRLESSLANHLNEPIELRPWRGGVDCWVDLVHRRDGAVQVVRSPRVEVLHTFYDGTVDFGDVLQHEAEVLVEVNDIQVPTPRLIATHKRKTATDPSWMLQELLPGTHPTECTPSLGRELGQITKAFHQARPNHGSLIPQSDWAAWVRNRISARLDAVRRYCDLPSDGAILDGAVPLLKQRQPAANSLLHLDLRGANLLTNEDSITGVLDFANALVGDPLFELARLRRYGMLDDNFFDGYGQLPDSVDDARLLELYELDTSALLTVVGIEEVDDPHLHRDNLERTRQLCSQIAAGG